MALYDPLVDALSNLVDAFIDIGIQLFPLLLVLGILALIVGIGYAIGKFGGNL